MREVGVDDVWRRRRRGWRGREAVWFSEGSVSSFRSRSSFPRDLRPTHLNLQKIQILLSPIQPQLQLNLNDPRSQSKVPRPPRQLIRRSSKAVVSEPVDERIVAEDDVWEEGLSCSRQAIASPCSNPGKGGQDAGELRSIVDGPSFLRRDM